MYHYANVVVPTSAMFSLRLDGQLLSSGFQGIEGTDYAYARIQLTPGPHTITAARPFGLMLYGYGTYNSYGHPAGMAFEEIPLSVDKPVEEDDQPTITARQAGDLLVVEALQRSERIAHVELFDAPGSRVTVPITVQSQERAVVDVGDLAAGTYFFRIMMEDGTVKVAGVVVQ